MKLLITGGTGLIGKKLIIEQLKRGHEIVALVRSPSPFLENLPCRSVLWNVEQGHLPLDAVRGIDAVIHLAGESIGNKSWTPKTKEQILSSRTQSTRLLVQTLQKLPPKERPSTFISASAIGIYGDTGNQIITEKGAVGKGFLAQVTQSWEKEGEQWNLENDPRVRMIRLRLGMVLDAHEGAFPKIPPLLFGDGKQWLSWIHITDVLRFIDFALSHAEVQGTFNLTAPSPCTTKAFYEKKAYFWNLPFPLQVPSWIAKWILGERAQLLLTSQRIIPERALASGFHFLFSDITSACQNLATLLPSHRCSFITHQWIPYPLEEVFAFFSSAKNLEKITPPWLEFKILSQSTPEIEENTRIHYQLKVKGIRFHWETKIEKWQPPFQFSDTQVQGPYTYWHHTHRFESLNGGTWMEDHVLYQVPLGILGRLFLYPWVRREVEKIFSYRQKRISALFPRKN